jgi:hypothetical protein
MKRTMLTVAVLAVLTGCQAQRTDWAMVVLPSSNAETAFEAARAVIAEEYTLAQTDAAEGVIVTQPKPFQRTGANRRPGAYLSSGNAQNFRRIVRCYVAGGASGAVIELKVDLEREGTSQAETLIVAGEDSDRRVAGAEQRWAHLGDHRATYWADIGRDEQAEKDLIQRIRSRIEQAVAPAEPASP